MAHVNATRFRLEKYSAGTFASFTSLDVDPDFVDPKIEIKNGGIINTPLGPEDVQNLTDACRPSPFGKGSQTIVDPAVRSSWEMDAEDFAITNPFWHHEIIDICDTEI
ncbi:hypothetical protein IWZ03DRAFT_359076 [Phyllosticta citriasiana]|uniref:Uncharacterized protein n=1 Tax=Phyllosticta citriasiana TaxID=595635 RepID=A0ABR1KSI2_9PEZI